MMNANMTAVDNDLGWVLSEAKCGVFIINLERRQDRWERISEHLKELNCHTFHRIDAIDGLLEPKELAKKVVRLNVEHFYKDNPTKRQMCVLGCLKSHLKALQTASGEFGKFEKALILEDDCFFIDSAADTLKSSLKELPPHWQVLMLGAVYGSAPGFISKKNSLMRVYNASAAHAYMVNQSSCHLLIQRIKALLESKKLFPIDEWFIKYQSRENWYATHPLIAGQLTGDFSDIDGVVRTHTYSCFKLGVYINKKVWLWMTIRPYLPIALFGSAISRVSSVWQALKSLF